MPLKINIENWGNTEFATVQVVPLLDRVFPDGIRWTTVLNVTLEDPGRIISAALTLPPVLNVLPTTFETFAWALVEWGSGGSVFRTIVDYIAGTVFSIPATWLRISAAHFDFTGGASSRRNRFGAIASLGPVSHGLPPQRTLRPVNTVIAAAGNSSAPIPPFAKEFSVFGINFNQNGSPGLTIRQQREDPGILVNHSVQVFGANVPIERVPIIGFARKINFQNDDALATDDMTIVYNLAL